MNEAKKSPHTTAGGVLFFLSLLFTALYAQFDGDPETVASWSPVVAAAFAAYALFKARDHNTSSEDAGLK